MSSKINYIILHLSAFALLPFSAIAQNDSITNDGISQRKKPYFSFDIGTGVSYRATENADKYNDIPSLWNYPNGTCVPRKARLFLSYGKFKGGVGFSFQKYKIKYYGRPFVYEEIVEKQDLFLSLGYYFINKKNYSIGLQSEFGYYDLYIYNDKSGIHTGNILLCFEPNIEIKLNNYASVYTSFCFAFKQNWNSKFTLKSNAGIRLKMFSGEESVNFKNNNISVSLGLSIGGAYNSRHFIEPSIIQENFGYNYSRQNLPSPSQYTFINIYYSIRNINNFIIGYGMTNSYAYTYPPGGDPGGSNLQIKDIIMYMQYDYNLLKLINNLLKNNISFYVGGKVISNFENVYYNYHVMEDMNGIDYDGFYSNDYKIFTFQSISGFRTMKFPVFFDIGIGYSIVPLLWGKYNYFESIENVDTDITENGTYYQIAKPFFSDFFVKIGYKF